jgi:ABC-type uncharacterized transport system permease subunit
MDSRLPVGSLGGEARNRLGRVGLVLGALGVALVVGMLAALEWLPWMQPPLIHVAIIFVGLPVAGVLGLVGAGLSAWGLGRPPRAGALSGLALNLLALALAGFGLLRVTSG